MKIKCPFCESEFESSDDLWGHLAKMEFKVPKHTNGNYMKKLCDIWFKIHENIETLQKPVVTDSMMHTAQSMIDGEIKLLESLLENK